MCKYWSTFDEIIRYLKSCDITNKKKLFLEHAECMANVSVRKPIYTPKDYQLPSICTLTRITSKFASQDDMLFLASEITGLQKNVGN